MSGPLPHGSDVVNALKWERLNNVVLCGHSYGGFVISGVAEKIPGAIASMVFVDAFVPENGDTLATLVSPATRDRIDEVVRKGDAMMAPIPAAVFQVNEKDRAWVEEFCVPQPLATFFEKAVLTGARELIPKRTYIRAAGYESPAFDAALAKVRAIPTWTVFELPCGHDIMVDMPDQLTEILLASA